MKQSVREPLVGDRIDGSAITERWPALLHLATLLKAGTVMLPVMLRNGGGPAQCSGLCAAAARAQA
ncbi:hypothetical protein [Arenibaculum pallidiluteum]|uniref:hypothetical protein n=1 Tax=Arenibaculum pallidiluteum TaxID=2812559 RepID=UPI001A956DD6|nr:hypothetical protein [Arenibaculum pallidiluteum]